MPPSPHPLVEPLLGLVGTWRGDGVGSLPGGDPFHWAERLEVGHGGTPALWFRQRTTRPDGTPFHAEDGWVRVPPELPPDGQGHRRVELAVASPTGVLEALDGTVETAVAAPSAIVLDASSTTTSATTVAATVAATRRRWTLSGDTLTVEFWMATPAHPEMFHHLTARLRRDT